MSPSDPFSVTGHFVDLPSQTIYPAEVRVEHGRIFAVQRLEGLPEGAGFLVPGFVDSHVHIESSMLVPSEFARLAVVHGTVATVSDPHEIANVCGLDGVEFMIANGAHVPFKFHFGAPSCVPATAFETAGAVLDGSAVEALLRRSDVFYLSEMMNFPGVLARDPEVMGKIASALSLGKPVDGHAPGLRGEEARRYVEAGISTDHECFTAEEALDKLGFGMKILIREGSAAKNFEALVGLLHDHWENMMFCSDDKHPDSLAAGHIDRLCARAVAKGVEVFKVLRAACVNPVSHYGLGVGLLQPGDPADFLVVDDLRDFHVRETYIGGRLVAQNGKTLIPSFSVDPPNNFLIDEIGPDSLKVASYGLPVIEAFDGQLITGKLEQEPRRENGLFVSDTDRDILKIVVVNRYKQAPPAVAFIKNFGLKEGALASSAAHDSHNLVAVGVDDESLVRAINLVIRERGGISCVRGSEEKILPLPAAGLMSLRDGYEVSRAYTELDALAKKAGSALSAPFMTLSFMALLVIPHVKLSDKGLFDGDAFHLYNNEGS